MIPIREGKIKAQKNDLPKITYHWLSRAWVHGYFSDQGCSSLERGVSYPLTSVQVTCSLNGPDSGGAEELGVSIFQVTTPPNPCCWWQGPGLLHCLWRDSHLAKWCFIRHLRAMQRQPGCELQKQGLDITMKTVPCYHHIFSFVKGIPLLKLSCDTSLYV